MGAKMLMLMTCMMASLAVAQGFFRRCPATNSVLSYTDPGVQGCADYQPCLATLCSCSGGTLNPNVLGNCTWTNVTNPTCSVYQQCYNAFTNCVYIASAVSLCMPAFKESLVSIVSGGQYNTSAFYTSCANFACNIMNQSLSANCSGKYDWGNFCPTPPSEALLARSVPYAERREVYLVLSGPWWPLVLPNLGSNGEPPWYAGQQSIADDIEATIGYVVNILSLRAGVSSDLTIDFQALTPPNDPNFVSNIEQLVTNGSWPGTTSVYTSNGGIVPPNITTISVTIAVTQAPFSGDGFSHWGSSWLVAMVVATCVTVLFSA